MGCRFVALLQEVKLRFAAFAKHNMLNNGTFEKLPWERHLQLQGNGVKMSMDILEDNIEATRRNYTHRFMGSLWVTSGPPWGNLGSLWVALGRFESFLVNLATWARFGSP